MKKLFTSILMIGVALTGWASVSSSYDEGTKTLTITYAADPNNSNEITNLNIGSLIPDNYRSAEKLVFVGDWANAHLSKIGSCVDYCCSNVSDKTVFVDLSQCNGMVSKVVPAEGEYNADIDWVTTAHTFSYSSGAPEEITVTQKTSYFFEDGTAPPYNADQVTTRTENGVVTYWWNGYAQGSDGEHQVYPKTEWGYLSNPYDQNSWVSVPTSAVTVNGNGTGTAMVQPTGDAFTFANGNFNNAEKYLNGIAFPSNANFTYIPEKLFMDRTVLRSVLFGQYTEWIGAQAFSGCTNLVLPVSPFPATMKVFGGDCFKNCYHLAETIDLSATPKIQIVDYMAFGTGTENVTSDIKYFILPSNNSSLKYFANYVVRQSQVTDLDFSGCYGIQNFAHDGKATFGEFSENWDSYWTFYKCENLKNITLPPNLTYVTKQAFDTCPSLETVTFKGSAVYDDSDCDNVTLTNPLVIDDKAFEAKSNLRQVTFSNNVTYIGEYCFKGAALTTVSLPASVELVRDHAFEDCTQLTTVIFDELTAECDCEEFKGAETVLEGGEGSGGQGHGAFNNCKAITDVYINTKALLNCINNGFDADITWGHGDSGRNLATLHYPEENIEHYVNLNHHLTDEIVASPSLFHDWLMEHYGQALSPPKNGWYEFINAGPSKGPDDPGTEEIILRTFSDYKYAYLVPDGLRAYVVSEINSSNGIFEVTLQRIYVIPAKTGVILYGHPNGVTQKGKPTLAMNPVSFEEGNGNALCRANWENKSDDEIDPMNKAFKNYLEPTSTNPDATETELQEHPEWVDGGLYVKPYENENDVYDQLDISADNPITFRNFSLGRYSSTKNIKNKQSLTGDETDYAAFFRMMKGAYSSGKAYLHLRADEFNDPTGAELLVKQDNGNPAYYWEKVVKTGELFDARDAANATKNPKGWWKLSEGFDWEIVSSNYMGKGPRKNWGVCPDRLKTISMSPKYYGEFEGDVDGIVKLVIPATDISNGEYYTLQGVKVTNPTKGVYISNGKKVIIK